MPFLFVYRCRISAHTFWQLNVDLICEAFLNSHGESFVLCSLDMFYITLWYLSACLSLSQIVFEPLKGTALSFSLSYTQRFSLASSRNRAETRLWMQVASLEGDSEKLCERVGSEAGKARQTMESVVMSMLVLWATGAHLTGDFWEAVWNSCQTCPTQGWGHWDVYPPTPILHWLRAISSWHLDLCCAWA